MGADRFVVLGLAGVRAPWFAEVARWATAATIPVDFVKVVSREEARARLLGGRSFSALLVDAGLGALDRDLVELASAHGCAVVAAEDGRAALPWGTLGVHAVLPQGFGPDDLLAALTTVAQPVARVDGATARTTGADPAPGQGAAAHRPGDVPRGHHGTAGGRPARIARAPIGTVSSSTSPSKRGPLPG